MCYKNFFGLLKIFNPSEIVFVGLGNQMRGDDYAGIFVLNKLKENKSLGESVFIEAGTTPENYLYPVLEKNPAAVVFIDAADFGGYPGEIKLINSEEIAGLSFSTHSYSIKMIEEFFNLNGIKSFYLGIQKNSTELNGKISPEVEYSIRSFVNTVL